MAIPITNLSKIYKNIETTMENSVTYEDMANANEIYYRIKYGTPAPNEGDNFIEWEDWIQGLTPEELEYHIMIYQKERKDLDCTICYVKTRRSLFTRKKRSGKIY